MTRKNLAKASQRREKTPLTIRKPEVKITSRGNVTQDLERIFQDGVLIDLSIGYWTAVRRNTTDDLGLAQEEIPEFVIGLGTKRLIKKELMESWTKIANKARTLLRKHSFQFPIGGCAFVPIAKLPMLDQELGALKAEFEKAVEYLWSHYDTIRDEMLAEFPEHRTSLARLFPPRDVARNAFYFTWDVFNVSVPRKAQLVAFDREKASASARERAERRAASEQALANYRTRLEQRMGQFLADVVTEMRTKIATACLRITERVKQGEVITDKSLNALRGVIDYYKAMNFPGDARIEDMLTSLDKDILAGRDAESFGSGAALTGALTTALNAIQTAAESVTDVSEITGGYKRKIRL